jgi:aspartyl/asparaginyl beta-hydroxylase (cupin superfamily)
VQQLVNAGRLSDAESALADLMQSHPTASELPSWAARLANQQGRTAQAAAILEQSLSARPDDPLLTVDLAVLLADAGRIGEAVALLRGHVQRLPDAVMSWLLLSQLLEDTGEPTASLLAAYEAITRAQADKAWLSPSDTPPHLRDFVGHAVAKVRDGRRGIFFDAIERAAQAHPGAPLHRIERAVRGYLGDIALATHHPRQKALVLYIPDLPDEPFMDPFLHPWARSLHAAFPSIRREAVSMLARGSEFQDFVQPKPGDSMDRYLAGHRPAWEALFFFRHGQRYDETHALCPDTSAALESIELFRVPGQAPEILFSVLTPGTHILPHHGVCNARSVMHLPLIVPPGCALNLVDVGQRSWQEGELGLFDDTYLHEAWNRSESIRVILLMDCWNPHLNRAEREAVVRLTQVIGSLDRIFDPQGWLGS